MCPLGFRRAFYLVLMGLLVPVLLWQRQHALR